MKVAPTVMSPLTVSSSVDNDDSVLLANLALGLRLKSMTHPAGSGRRRGCYPYRGSGRNFPVRGKGRGNSNGTVIVLINCYGKTLL